MKKLFLVVALFWLPYLLHAEEAKVWDLKFLPASSDSIKLQATLYSSPDCAGRRGLAITYQGDTMIVHGYYILASIGIGSSCVTWDTLNLGKWSANPNINVIKVLPYLIDTSVSPNDTVVHPPGGHIHRSLNVKNGKIAKNDTHVFPNPVSQTLFIETERKINNVMIQDMFGRVAYSYSGSKDKIDISAMSSGIYILRLETDNGVVVQKIKKE